MSLELSENRANAAENAPVARPPSAFEKLTDRSFRLLTRVFALAIVGLVAWVVLQIVWSAIPAIQKHGLGFLTGLTWDPSREQFGILPEIWGTLYSSLLGLGLGAFFGLAIAIV
jgi:phosphate transport system permease protein